MTEAIQSGAGLRKLSEMFRAQGASADVCQDVSLLPQAPVQIPVPAPRDGYVVSMDTTEIGYCAQHIGAGRVTKADAIDPAVGLVMQVRLGDYVHAGDPLCTLHLRDKSQADAAVRAMQEAVCIGEKAPEKRPLVYAFVSADETIYAEGYGPEKN